MYAVIYSFQTRPGSEDQFVEAWTKLTRLIYENRGSLGSRLHKASEGEYIAYAQWPDKASWQKPWEPMPEAAQAASQQMREACTEIKTLYQLEMETDLLKDFTFSSKENH